MNWHAVEAAAAVAVAWIAKSPLEQPLTQMVYDALFKRKVVQPVENLDPSKLLKLGLDVYKQDQAAVTADIQDPAIAGDIADLLCFAAGEAEGLIAKWLGSKLSAAPAPAPATTPTVTP